MTATTNRNLADTLARMDERLASMEKTLEALQQEVRPVSKAYEAATTTAKVLKWTVGLLASFATLSAALAAAWQYMKTH